MRHQGGGRQWEPGYLTCNLAVKSLYWTTRELAHNVAAGRKPAWRKPVPNVVQIRRSVSRLLAALWVCVLIAPLASLAESEGTASSDGLGGYLTYYLDNDLFAGTDRNYTNGLRLSWVSEAEPLFDLFPAQGTLERIATSTNGFGWLRSLSGFRPESIEQKALQLNYGLSLTQLMFTPEDFEAPTQPVGERRYAGWLGLGFSVHARDDQAVNSVELMLGVTGRYSLAEQAQNLVHGLRNIEKFEGWDDQVPTEVTLDFSFLQKRRVPLLPTDPNGFGIDGISEWGVRLGTFRTAARIGGFFRVGFHLDGDYSDPRLSPTAYSHRYFKGDALTRWSAFMLFGATGTGVAHDATLDGPLFRSFDTGNTREPWVGEVFTGFGVRWAAVEFSYVHTWRTQEYQEKDGAFNFGSLSVRVQL